ncbi:hypothetical protein C0Q70_00514 [Pomacea canaliculata]|uniref:Uncharacterized protein n=1 Tax=Pomacea canaliculata TaxID=400727 RepID=A0A2T7PWW3_POMCA|nr:hypothetical protein C0Q70_00514 [Pomacea canaliculata]
MVDTGVEINDTDKPSFKQQQVGLYDLTPPHPHSQMVSTPLTAMVTTMFTAMVTTMFTAMVTTMFTKLTSC